MLYKDFQGMSLSALGMGCMRFPCDANKNVDMAATAEMIDVCLQNGVNYFDTAWFYHGGKSESIMGELLSKYPRESYYLATKLPGHEYKSRQEVAARFHEQLRRTRAGYFDFYLLHNVCEDNVGIFTDPALGIADFLREQKAAGRIRHLGISTHGSLALMEKFISAHRDIVEFCQIQLNWLDWTLQDAKAKVELLNRFGIPIWVMEPLRGGKLATLSEEDASALSAMRPAESIPAWSFRFLQGIPGVTMVLSGMSSFSQVTDNIATFGTSAPLDAEEQKALFRIADAILAKKTLTCTGCKYCTEDCPMELDIPKLLSLYNKYCLTGGKVRAEAVACEVENGKLPSACVGCRTCEGKCPQKIKISEIMSDFADRL